MGCGALRPRAPNQVQFGPEVSEVTESDSEQGFTQVAQATVWQQSADQCCRTHVAVKSHTAILNRPEGCDGNFPFWDSERSKRSSIPSMTLVSERRGSPSQSTGSWSRPLPNHEAGKNAETSRASIRASTRSQGHRQPNRSILKNDRSRVSSCEDAPVNSIYRPKRIVLIRHGQSEANVDRGITASVPDHALHLTEEGRLQAVNAGTRLKEIIGFESAIFMVSPYVRARETFNGIATAYPGTDIKVREDVQIREQDFGNFDKNNMKELHSERNIFGSFYYRFPEGESIADVYDRASHFLESLYRRWEFSRERNTVVISHGIFLLVFLMRLFRFTVEEFYSFAPLKNCEFVVLERLDEGKFFSIAYSWTQDLPPNIGGLRLLPIEQHEQRLGAYAHIWDGDLSTPLVRSSKARYSVQVDPEDDTDIPSQALPPAPHEVAGHAADLSGGPNLSTADRPASCMD